MRLVALGHFNWVTFGVRRRILMNSKMEFPIPSTGTFTFGPAERGKTDQVDLTINDPTTDTYSTRSSVPRSGSSFSTPFRFWRFASKRFEPSRAWKSPGPWSPCWLCPAAASSRGNEIAPSCLNCASILVAFKPLFTQQSVRTAPCEWSDRKDFTNQSRIKTA